MSESTKIAFSTHEWECLHNTAFFGSKHSSTDKIVHFLGQLAELYKERMDSLPQPILAASASAKISKGENHKGLPYIVLDYPRIKPDSDNYILVRTVFWWGKSVSIQMLVAGHFLLNLQAPCITENVWINTTEEALWDNDIQAPGFVHIDEVLNSPVIQKTKLAYTWPLELLGDDTLTTILLAAFENLLSAIE